MYKYPNISSYRILYKVKLYKRKSNLFVCCDFSMGMCFVFRLKSQYQSWNLSMFTNRLQYYHLTKKDQGNRLVPLGCKILPDIFHDDEKKKKYNKNTNN